MLFQKKTYTIIISKDLNVWGSYYKEANDVARLQVPVTEAADSLEYFSMVLPKLITVSFKLWTDVRVAASC
jgi:hypothetical protein